MDRKKLGIIASALVLLVLMVWLTQDYVAGVQSATAAKVANPDANSASTTATASAAPRKTANAQSGTPQHQSNATLAAQTGPHHTAATSTAHNDKSGNDTNNNAAPSQSPTQTRARIKPAPLEPRAEPYALMANSGSATVRFSVRLTGDADPSTTVYLRQSGAEGVIALNDQGVDGDIVAGDNIHGGNIVLDTSRLQPDTCLSYFAMLKDGESETASSPLSLCISNLPVRAAASNTDNPVMFADGTKVVADELLVTAQPGTKIATMQTLAASINATIVGSIPPLNLYQLKLAAPASEAQLTALVGQLNARPEVKGASINAIGSIASTPNDPAFNLPPGDVNSQHGLKLVLGHNQTTGANAWDIGATGNGVIVTVLDSGLDRTHPDFGTVGNCQLKENDCGGTNTDALGHGTQVAGIIGAKTSNALGIAGIAHGSKIHSIQVSPDASVTDIEMAQGFSNAAAYGAASVINASFGTLNAFGNWTPVCAAIESAVQNTGVPVAIVVNGAGNNNSNGAFYPSRCNDLNTALSHKDLFITVAASASTVEPNCGADTIDLLCTFSNFGAWVDIAAPGSAIRTTTIGAPQPPAGNYASPSGTSFSAPMVSGAVAILKQCGVPLGDDPATPLVIEGIEQVLKTSGANVMVSFPDGSSAPRLDIHRALAQVNHPPTALGITNNSLSDGTDTSTGVEVGALTRTDVDTCDKHTYSIFGGADAASFSIGGTANDKLILTAGVLNHATKPSYTVTVRVTDYFGSPFDQAVTVNVIAAPPVNHAPVIDNQTFSINESSANGTAVGTVTASDQDVGNTISYSITAGNTGSAFAIDSTTGEITVSNPLSYATTPTYALTVQVTDNGGLFATATVTINVNNPAAANNQPNISAQTFSVSESSGNGTAVGTVAASDPDVGDSLNYSITAGNTGGAFALNATTGALTVSNALSYATTPTYALTVRVTDGVLSASATVTVNVNAAAAPPPANPPASSGGGGGGCSVMPVGASPDSSLALAVLVLLGYGVWRRVSRKRGKPRDLIQ